MSLINESQQKKSVMFCKLLQKEIDVIIINSIPYANWKTSSSWIPEEWKSGIVEFEAVDPEKLVQITYGKVIDIDTGIQFKILNPTLDKDGHPSFKILKYTRKKSYDLSVIAKRAEAFILAHQLFVNSKYGENQLNYVKMKSIESAAQDNRKRRKKLAVVMNLIDKMDETSLRDFARLLIPVNEADSEEVIKDRLEEIAEKMPDTVMTEYNRTDRSAKEVFIRAQNYNVIQLRPDTGYTFAGNRLGYNEVEVLNYFKANPMIMSSVHNKTSTIIDQSVKNKIKNTEEFEVLSKSVNVNQADKSVHDNLIEAGAKQALNEKGYQTSDILKAMEDISNKMLLKVDEKLNPLTQKVNEIMKEKENLDLRYSTDEENDKDEFENSMNKEIKELEDKILMGKSIDKWEYKDLKKHCKENYDINAYRSNITLKKDALFDWILNHRKDLLSKGKHTAV